MELQEGKDRFIESWGKMGTNWGISRTMAQIHALLLVSNKPLSATEVMDELKISRGNTHQNLKSLLDWGLIHKELRCGDRKDYFFAEKDMWTVFKQIIIERKKRELEPMIEALDQLSPVESQDPESIEFCKTVRELNHFSKRTNTALETLINSDANAFISRLFNIV